MAWTIRAAEASDEAATVGLWCDAGLVAPYNDPGADFRFARNGANSDILVAKDADGSVVGGVMVGHDGHRGWIYYLAACPRGVGIGRSLVEAAERWLTTRDIRKLQLMIRPENDRVAAFYETLGLEVTPRIIMAKWLSPSSQPPWITR